MDAPVRTRLCGEGLVFGTKATRSQDAGEKGRLTRQAFDRLAEGQENTRSAMTRRSRVTWPSSESIRCSAQAGLALRMPRRNFDIANRCGSAGAGPVLLHGEAYKKAYRFGDSARRIVPRGAQPRTATTEPRLIGPGHSMERIQRASPRHHR